MDNGFLGSGLAGVPLDPRGGGKLHREFLVPPFSVLNAREGEWQERKKLWVNQYKLTSHLGREENLIGYSQGAQIGDGGTSIFDPVLAEIMYRWYSAKYDRVLDPFAGGSVRGIVAAALGRRYRGIDVRPEQVEANNEAAVAICEPMPSWIAGDSRAVLGHVPKGTVDFILTCPPYGSLEVYSDLPDDISGMGWYDFQAAYTHIMAGAAACLAPNRFACVVTGNYREGTEYRDLLGLTHAAMSQGGARLYAEAVLVTAVSSASMRARRIFGASRKIVKTHQNVSIYVVGDAKEAALRLAEQPVD